MSDTKTPGDKTLHVSSPKTLTLKRTAEQGVVRQSFSHGRSKAVVVEKVKRRVIGPGEAKEAAAPKGPTVAKAPPAQATAAPAAAPAGMISVVVMPSSCGTTRFLAISSKIAARLGSTTCRVRNFS